MARKLSIDLHIETDDPLVYHAVIEVLRKISEDLPETGAHIVMTDGFGDLLKIPGFVKK